MCIGFTRYAVFAPIRDATAATVLALQTHLFGPLGFPAVLQFDGGSCFNNELMRDFLKQHGIEAHRIIAYNHKSRGAVERFNRTVVDMLRTAIDGSISHWANYIRASMRADNSAFHGSCSSVHSHSKLQTGHNTPPLRRYSGSAHDGIN